MPQARPLLAALTMTELVGGCLSVAQAVVLADIIGAQFKAHRGSVTHQLVALALIGLLRAGGAATQEWGTSRAAIHVQAMIRSRTLSAITHLGPAWSERQPAGRLVTATGTGLEAVEGYVTRALPAMVAACVVPPVALIAIGVADWQSAAVLVVVLPLIPVFMVLVGITTRRRMTAQYAALAAMAGHFLDLVQGLTTLKIYGQAHRQRDTVERDAENYRRSTMGMLRMAFMSALVLDLVATLGIAVVAVDVGLRLDAGHLTLTRALVVLLLAPALFAPLRAVGAQFHANEAGQAAIGAALDIIDEAALQLQPARSEADDFTGSLRLDALSVTHPDRTEPALRSVSLLVLPGHVVGIRGVSGAGKSTLLAAVLGFVATRDAVARSTAAGWRSSGTTDRENWRGSMAWVPQHPCPTQVTVALEVMLGDPTATGDELASVLTLCQTPKGSTGLGEDGTAISAGERRRVALARAVLRARSVIATGQTPLMLLDEPSEDLDEATQNVVFAAIASLAGLATILIATHSETLLAMADVRVVLASGRVESVTDQQPARGFVKAPVPAQRRHATAGATPDAQAQTPPHQFTLSKRRLLLPSLISGAAGLSGLALTATSIWLICRAAERPNVQALAIAVVGVRTFALSRALLRYAERLSGHDAALRILRDVRGHVFGALIPLAPGGLAHLRRGDLLRRFTTDVDAVQEGLVRSVIPTAGAAVTALGAVAFAAVIDPLAGATLAVGLLLAVVVMPVITRSLAGPGTEAAQLLAYRDARVSATLDGLAELTAYGAHHAALRDVAILDGNAGRASRRACAAAGIGSLLAGVTCAATLVGVLTVGVHAHALAPVSVGLLLAGVLASFDAVAPLSVAHAAWGRFAAANARVAEVIDSPPVMPAGGRSAPDGPLLGMEAYQVDLAVGKGRSLLIVGASFTVRPGERVAIIGASGSGKSTLLAAAMRLNPVTAGSISITSLHETVPLCEVTPDAVTAVVAGSLQGDHVFNASLRDNLRVVKPDATDAELDAVAERIDLLDVVHSLPAGWATIAGVHGAALSGGQRQRLLLARALLANPAVLVLDEPTAHLDAETEQAVLAGLLSHSSQSMLISTHRQLPGGSLDAVLRIGHGGLTTAREEESLMLA